MSKFQIILVSGFVCFSFAKMNLFSHNLGNNYYNLSKLYLDCEKYDSSCLSFNMAIEGNGYNVYRPYSIYKYLYSAVASRDTYWIRTAVHHAKYAGIQCSDISESRILASYAVSILDNFEKIEEPTEHYFTLDSSMIIALLEMKNYDQSRSSGNTYIIDSINFKRFNTMLKNKSFPTQKTVGYSGMNDVYLLIQHFFLAFPEKQDSILKLVTKQIDLGCYDPHEYAVLIDRSLAFKKQLILYGSLLASRKKSDFGDPILPTECIENVDLRRKLIGIEPLSYYLKQNGIEVFPTQYIEMEFREVYKTEISHLK